MDWTTMPRKPTDEDPLVMYFIIRQSLGMGAGKVGAQCAHACQLILIANKEKRKNLLAPNPFVIRMNYWNDRNINGGFRKVVLRANDKEWEYLKEVYNPVIVQDAGLTEVDPGSETVMVLWPMFKNERCKVLKRLQALK